MIKNYLKSCTDGPTIIILTMDKIKHYTNKNGNTTYMYLCCSNQLNVPYKNFKLLCNFVVFIGVTSVSVQNSIYSSKLFINADIPEVEEFKNR